MMDSPATPDRPEENEHGAEVDPGQPASPGATPDAEQSTPTSGATFANGMADAARRAGFAAAAEGEPINGHALLASMGGIRGLVEAVLPGLVFLVIYTFSRDLVLALIAPVLVGLVFVGFRLAAKQTLSQAVGGLVVIGISAVLALLTGNAEDFYLPGFWTNGVYGAVLLVSALVGWPLIGLAVGFLMGEGLAWRTDPSKRRVLTILTLAWAGLFAVRLIVQLPLYYSGNVELLGAMKLLMGLPLYAPLLIVSWLMVRSVYPKQSAPTTDD